MSVSFVRLSDRFVNLDQIVGVELLDGGTLRVATPYEVFYLSDRDAETLTARLNERARRAERSATAD